MSVFLTKGLCLLEEVLPLLDLEGTELKLLRLFMLKSLLFEDDSILGGVHSSNDDLGVHDGSLNVWCVWYFFYVCVCVSFCVSCWSLMSGPVGVKMIDFYGPF